jgi:hypothetical protein
MRRLALLLPPLLRRARGARGTTLPPVLARGCATPGRGVRAPVAIVWTAGVLAGAPASLGAQAQAPAPAAAPPAAGRLAGTVYDSVAGRPLAGALVWVA